MTLLQTQQWASDTKTVFLLRQEHCSEKKLNWEGVCTTFWRLLLPQHFAGKTRGILDPRPALRRAKGRYRSISDLYPVSITSGMLWLERAEPCWVTASGLCGQSGNGGASGSTWLTILLPVRKCARLWDSYLYWIKSIFQGSFVGYVAGCFSYL